MEQTFLLLDFGASRIKSALLSGGKITRVESHCAIAPCINEGKRYEVSLEEIKNKFLEIANSHFKSSKFSAIFLCSEMHGFALLSESNEPLSDYISWKDERCTEVDPNEDISSFDILKEKLGQTFFQKTGMNPRACHPIFNLFHMIRKNEVRGKKIKVVSLPEWLCACEGNFSNTAHCTMSAGLGFYNIYKNSWDEELIKAVQTEGMELKFSQTSSEIRVGGYIELQGEKIPIYNGVGDHQCAVLGSGNDDTTISVNLGTGSQVALIGFEGELCEKRPYFQDKMLSVVTHIPSGRALNHFIGFLEQINPQINFWNELSKISLEDIKNSTLNFDLAVFKSAWGYSNGACIANIEEGGLNLKNYLSSLLRCYVEQYKSIINFLAPTDEYSKIILSGGIANKLGIIQKYLQELSGYSVALADGEYDETLVGLRKIVYSLGEKS